MRDTLDIHIQLLDIADNLRPLPQSAVALASAVVNPRLGPRDLAPIIGKDTALIGLILREANSAASGARDRIGSLETAVSRLGGTRVLSLAVGDHVHSELDVAMPCYQLSAGELGRHSTAVAVAAEVLNSHLRSRANPDVVTAALLHDFGKVVLSKLLDVAAARPLIEAGETTAGLERDLVAVDHADVGAYIAEAWGLPETLVDTIRNHHNPGESREAAVVCLADSLAHRLAPSDHSWAAPDASDVAAVHVLGVGDDLEVIEDEVTRRYETESLI
ncbi:MAG: HDOD domain-containing protein [Actinomycetia bacterium]|nr:HDOD domain-containing protein [Actinomycetes bacterium]